MGLCALLLYVVLTHPWRVPCVRLEWVADDDEQSSDEARQKLWAAPRQRVRWEICPSGGAAGRMFRGVFEH